MNCIFWNPGTQIHVGTCSKVATHESIYGNLYCGRCFLRNWINGKRFPSTIRIYWRRK